MTPPLKQEILSSPVVHGSRSNLGKLVWGAFGPCLDGDDVDGEDEGDGVGDDDALCLVAVKEPKGAM